MRLSAVFLVGLGLLGLAAILVVLLPVDQAGLTTKDYISYALFTIFESGDTSREDKAIKQNPNDAAAYMNRGMVRGESGDRQGAIADLTQVIRINITDADANAFVGSGYFQRAEQRRILGDKQGAREDYLKAAESYRQQGKMDDYEGVLGWMDSFTK